MWLNLTLRLPSKPASVAAGRRTVDCALESIDVDEQTRRDVSLAVSEACSNVVQHAGQVRGYSISVVADDDRCVVDVADDGRGIGTERLAAPLPGVSAERGRGLHIIRAVMDGVQVASGPAGGLIIRMVKRLIPGDAKSR
jgi:serine/threonine-protein kinase RsbW